MCLSLYDVPLHVSDNYFDLKKGEIKQILIKDVDLTKQREKIEIISLYDVLKKP